MKIVELYKNDSRKVTELTEYTGQKLHEISKIKALALTSSTGPKMTLFNIAMGTRNSAFFPELKRNFFIIYDYISVRDPCSTCDFNVYK